MRLSRIALGNLQRRKGRSAFLVLGFAVGIGTVIALYTLSTALRDEIGVQLDQYGANIVVVPRSNSLTLDYGGLSVSGVSFDNGKLTTDDVHAIRSIPYRNRLSILSPKTFGVVDSDGGDFLLAGVSFESELRMKRWWRIHGRSPASPDEILLGHGAARELGVIRESAPSRGDAAADAHAGHNGDEHVALSRDSLVIRGVEFRVAGVLAETGGRDDAMIFADLDRTQSLLGRPGELSLIEVSALCKDCPVETIVAQIQEALPQARVSAIQQAVRARTETVERLTRFSAVVSVIVLLIGGLMVAGTLTASVVERTREIGVLSAVGYRRRHIVQVLFVEVAALSLAGGLAGWLLGTAASALASPYFLQFGRPWLWDPLPAIGSVALALLLGALGGIFPARKAASLDPTEALRHI